MAHKHTDMVRFKVLDWIKQSNKDLIPKFEELERKRFKGHIKAYHYICENFGSAFFSCVEIYINGELSSYYRLKT